MQCYKCTRIVMSAPKEVLNPLNRFRGTCVHVVDFYLVPVEKVGHSDEHDCREKRTVEVMATTQGVDLQTSKYETLPDAKERAIFWFARLALKEGLDKTELNDTTADLNIDLSQVVVDEPFEVTVPKR